LIENGFSILSYICKLFQKDCSKTSSIILGENFCTEAKSETFIEWWDRFYTQKFRIEVTAQYKDTTNLFQEEIQNVFP